MDWMLRIQNYFVYWRSRDSALGYREMNDVKKARDKRASALLELLKEVVGMVM